MSHLKPETRALLELGREADEPSQEDLARIRQALARRVGVGVLSGVAGMAAGCHAEASIPGLVASGKGMTLLASVVVGGTVALGAVATDYALRSSWTPTPSLESASPQAHRVSPRIPARDRHDEIQTGTDANEERSRAVPPIVSASGLSGDGTTSPEVHRRAEGPSAVGRAGPRLDADHVGLAMTAKAFSDLPPPLVQVTVKGAPSAPTQTAAALETVPTASATTKSSLLPPSIAAELDLLQGAQRALHAGRAMEALAALDEHARLFPSGALREEREASRVLALCALGRSAESRMAISRFEKENPRSPFVRRVHEACKTPVPNSPHGTTVDP